MAKLLLVDDDPHLISGLKRNLRKEPYEILSAHSAKEALTTLTREKIDVIVSDEKMPGMNGVEFLSIVYQSYPDIIRIILTGNANLEMAIKAINDGKIYRFLTKPCNEYELAITIRQAIQQKELMEKSTRLLKAFKTQSATIEKLEKEHPGITKVQKDKKGSVVIDENFGDYNELMKELGAEIEKVEKRLGR